MNIKVIALGLLVLYVCSAPPARSNDCGAGSPCERRRMEALKLDTQKERLNNVMREQHESHVAAVRAQIAARENLVQLYEKAGQPDEARALRLEIEQHKQTIKRLEQELADALFK